MSEAINHDRRRSIGATAALIAVAKIGTLRAAEPSSFGPLKQIAAGALNIGYAEAGPGNGAPVLLLHGWPYDIHTYVDVAPLLASAGWAQRPLWRPPRELELLHRGGEADAASEIAVRVPARSRRGHAPRSSSPVVSANRSGLRPQALRQR